MLEVYGVFFKIQKPNFMANIFDYYLDLLDRSTMFDNVTEASVQ